MSKIVTRESLNLVDTECPNYFCDECGRVYDRLDELWIQCDSCDAWFHGACVHIREIDLEAIDKFHCFKCEERNGTPSIFKSITNQHRHNQYEENPSDKIQAGTKVFITQLRKRTFEPADNVIINLPATQLTVQYLVKHGFDRPILVENKDGLDMQLPPEGFDVQQIMNDLGSHYELDVIDCRRQISFKMSLVDFVRKINLETRDQILNCISLEVSKTRLGNLIKAPAIVNKISWVENCWAESEMKPHVSKYCLMSMRDSYTDFHIDFGGTSVWYHLLDGEKIFYLIEPTDKNLEMYEKWMNCPNQTEIWFPDMLDSPRECTRFVIKKGQTLFIPTGWIHAVLTSQDSLVFGGNFLNIFNMKLQFRIHEMETNLDTLDKFMFPYFELTHWYAVHFICLFLSKHYSKKSPPQAIKEGVEALWDHLTSWYEKTKSEDKMQNGDFSPFAPKNEAISLLYELQRTLTKHAAFRREVCSLRQCASEQQISIIKEF